MLRLGRKGYAEKAKTTLDAVQRARAEISKIPELTLLSKHAVSSSFFSHLF